MRAFLIFLLASCGGRIDGFLDIQQNEPFHPNHPAEANYCTPGPSLYKNDFEDGARFGSIYPRNAGQGSLCNDATNEAAFYPQYRPRSVTFPDGTHGIRFPTSQETSGGYDYSMQSAYVLFRGGFLNEKCLSIRFVIRMPER